LAAAFIAAIAADKPLLTIVSEKHRDAWSNFAPGAIFLTADKTVLQDWWRVVRMGCQEERPLLGASKHSAAVR
jgi:hypothetical protein